MRSIKYIVDIYRFCSLNKYFSFDLYEMGHLCSFHLANFIKDANLFKDENMLNDFIERLGFIFNRDEVGIVAYNSYDVAYRPKGLEEIKKYIKEQLELNKTYHKFGEILFMVDFNVAINIISKILCSVTSNYLLKNDKLIEDTLTYLKVNPSALTIEMQDVINLFTNGDKNKITFLEDVLHNQIRYTSTYNKKYIPNIMNYEHPEFYSFDDFFDFYPKINSNGDITLSVAYNKDKNILNYLFVDGKATKENVEMLFSYLSDELIKAFRTFFDFCF